MCSISKSRLERIKRLREGMLVPPEICTEKGRYMTESYRETEGEPVPLRRAKALSHILENLSITIEDDELLVGRQTSKRRGGALNPEINASWYLAEMDSFHSRRLDPYAPLSEQEKKDIAGMCEYWEQRSLYAKYRAALPEEYLPYIGTLFAGGAYCANTQYYGHMLTDYAKILRLGVSGIKREIDAALAGLAAQEGESWQYLTAMKLSLDAAVSLAGRYSRLAADMAAACKDKSRRAELEQIAQICSRVPEQPAQSLREAVQSMWLCYIAVSNEGWGAGPSLSRPDQYLLPYYLEDIERGVISGEETVELLAMLLIRMNGQFTVYSETAAETFGGVSTRLSLTLGGQLPQGGSAVNELSYLFLDAAQLSALAEDMVILTGESTPEPFLIKAAALAAKLQGKIKFVGQDVLERQLVQAGREPELARNSAVTGCNSPGVVGRSLETAGGMVNLPLILDLALNNGYSPMLKRQLGPKTGDPRSFTRYDELWSAFCGQFEALAPIIRRIRDLDKELFGEYMPCLLQSSLMTGCIESATDVVRGGTRPHFSFAVSLAGSPNVGDSLAAIKKCVFEDGTMSMETLLTALRADFAGFEAQHRRLLTAPKFGNNEPYVDELVNEVLCFCSDVIAASPGYLGAGSTSAAATITANLPLGTAVGAQPDGRRAGAPLAEGGISPHQGRNTSGITAALSSVSGLDHMRLRNGSVLNLRLDPKSVDSEEKIWKLAMLIRAFHKAGGLLVQFNIVSTETLRAAQKNPAQYKDLLVRVATYSAYFVELSELLQEDIIARVEVRT